MFKELQESLQSHFATMSTHDKVRVLYADIDREGIYAAYLAGFPNEEDRLDSMCNACNSFLRSYGGILFVDGDDYIIESIWEHIPNVTERYKGAIESLNNYVVSVIQDSTKIGYFGTTESQAGIKQSYSEKHSCNFNHFHLVIPSSLRKNPTTRAEMDSIVGVFHRSLEEFKADSIETVLELINGKALYRGEEYKKAVEDFNKHSQAYNKLEENQLLGYAYFYANNISIAVSKIRNNAMGTLLQDVAGGMELDVAVTRWEKVMAPSNFKRSVAIATPRMLETAKGLLQSHLLYDPLLRRPAEDSDLNIENLLFTNTPTAVGDVFDTIIENEVIVPRQLKNVTEIGIEEFISSVIPTTNTMKVLAENQHLGNLVALITEQNPTERTLFPWTNPFSWAYTGDITDSMKERVKAAGGNIDAPIRFSIQWNEDGKSIIDLDAHMFEPDGTHIYFGKHRHPELKAKSLNGGCLDVDMQSPRGTGIENLVYQEVDRMMDGIYQLKIHNYSGHKNFDGVRIQVELFGTIHSLSFDRSFTDTITVGYIHKKDSEFFFEPKLEGGVVGANSQEKWGLKTHTWLPVSKMCLSPNFWDGSTIGNKHYFFFVEGCQADEALRPFFNEFLLPELTTHRKSMEMVSAKLKFTPKKPHLGGLGFSSTQRNSVYVQTEGRVKRIFKVNF